MQRHAKSKNVSNKSPNKLQPREVSDSGWGKLNGRLRIDPPTIVDVLSCSS